MDGRASAAILIAGGEPRTFASVGAALAHARTLQPGGRVGIAAGARAGRARPRRGAPVRRGAGPGPRHGRGAVGGGRRRRVPRRRAARRPGRAGPRLGAPVGGARSAHPDPAVRGARPRDRRRAPRRRPAARRARCSPTSPRRPERVAERGELIDVLWPHHAPREPQTALRPILSRLRRALGPDALEGRERLRLAAARAGLDRPGRGRGRARRRARRRPRGAVGLRPARTPAPRCACCAPASCPASTTSGRRRAGSRSEELELEALEWTARASLGLGPAERGDAERAGRELVARSPFRETGHRFLMEALAGAGNVAEALRVYDDLRVLLRDELGTAPAAELQALHQRLLAGEGARREIAGEPPRGRAPRAGSPRASARPSSARDRELAAAARRLGGGARRAPPRLVLVAGEPGIGKTRLAREFADAAHGRRRRALRRLPGGGAGRLPAVRGGAARRRARLGRGSPACPARASSRGVIPELPAPPAAGGRATPRSGATCSSRRSRRCSPTSPAGAAGAGARRPALGRPRHAAPAAPRRPRAARGAAARRSARTATPRSAPRTRWPSCWPTCAATGWSSGSTLDGLDEREVGALIAAHAGHAAPPALVGAVHEHTDGNPFFVEEVLRHLIETGVARRARRPLDVGADAGRDRRARGRAGGARAAASRGCRSPAAPRSPRPRCSGASSPSTCSRATVDTRRGGADRRARGGARRPARASRRSATAAPATPSPTRSCARRSTRGSAGRGASACTRARPRAIERGPGDAERVAALALHHRLAGAAGDPAKAVEYVARRPARRPRRCFAWEEAAAHWEGALDVMTRVGGREPERARLLVALADLMVVVGDLGRQIALPGAGARALRASSATPSGRRGCTRGSAWRGR